MDENTYSHKYILPKGIGASCLGLLLTSVLHVWQCIRFRLHGHTAEVHLEEVVRCLYAWTLDIGIPCILLESVLFKKYHAQSVTYPVQTVRRRQVHVLEQARPKQIRKRAWSGFRGIPRPIVLWCKTGRLLRHRIVQESRHRCWVPLVKHVR